MAIGQFFKNPSESLGVNLYEDTKRTQKLPLIRFVQMREEKIERERIRGEKRSWKKRETTRVKSERERERERGKHRERKEKVREKKKSNIPRSSYDLLRQEHSHSLASCFVSTFCGEAERKRGREREREREGEGERERERERGERERERESGEFFA